MENKYAGFWWRFIAYLLDGAILRTIQFIFFIPFIGTIIYTAIKSSDGEFSEAQAIGIAGAIAGTLLS